MDAERRGTLARQALVKCYVECVSHRDEVTAKGVAEAEAGAGERSPA